MPLAIHPRGSNKVVALKKERQNGERASNLQMLFISIILQINLNLTGVVTIRRLNETFCIISVSSEHSDFIFLRQATLLNGHFCAA